MNDSRYTGCAMTSGLQCLLSIFVSMAVLQYPALAQSGSQDEREMLVSINTPIMQLLEREDAKEIVSKYLPNLVKALEERLEVQEFLGSSSLLELSIDDEHVIGFEEEMLAALKTELEALAQ
ncbi:MAG: hypothetical protein O2948_00755 [Proteobacteria bacterium]|nr:hypothetical protein [Pseudomonadota bacterium]MDA0927160.1 hypothetical protein [Pseudomonadota bacterium]